LTCILRHHESVAERAAGAAARTHVAFTHGRRQLTGPKSEQRPQAAEDADGDRHRGREREHPAVDGDGGRARKLVAGKGDEGHHGPEGEEDADRAACEREEQGLGGQLPREVTLGRAQRQTDGQLATPRQARCQQQVRDVGARD
jgi:hypothetical protein